MTVPGGGRNQRELKSQPDSAAALYTIHTSILHAIDFNKKFINLFPGNSNR
jgi:hypothetical protein